MTKRSCILALSLILSASAARGDNDLKSLRDLGNKAWTAFAQHHPDDGRPLYEDFLQQVEGSNTALRDTQIEIVLGVLGCLIPEHRTLGRRVLDHVIENGKGISQIRINLKSVRDDCTDSQTVPVLPASTWNLIVASASSGVGVSGKGGNPTARPVASVAVSHIDPAEFERRLQETTDPSVALSKILVRFGNAGTVTDHFIVAVDNGGKVRADGIAKCLDTYGSDLVTEFNMLYPSHLITVYTSAWDETVYQLAAHLHGLQLAEGTIAYSVYADLSMVGAGSPAGCGSLAHELTHLMIRGNFGDAPAWVEEGLASAVALSEVNHGHLNFYRGWRDVVLREKWSMRPTVAQLVNLTWDDFSPANSGDMNRAAAVQAMASVFVRYLASRNKLQNVYFAVRDHDLMTDLGQQVTTQQILEKEMGMSLTDLDKEFVVWFNNQEPARASQPVSTPRPCGPNEQPSLVAQEMPCKPAVMNQINPPPK